MATETTAPDYRELLDQVARYEDELAEKPYSTRRRKNLQQAQRALSSAQSGGSVPYGDIGEMINRFQADQARQQFEMNLPGYQDMVTQRSGNIASQLRGEVPQDVVAQLIQQGAERGIAGGMGAGGPNQNAAYLRALGLTSIEQQDRGAAGLSTAIADTPTAPLFDVGGMFAGDVRGQQELDALLKAQKQQNTQPRVWQRAGGVFSPETGKRYGISPGGPGGTWGRWG